MAHKLLEDKYLVVESIAIIDSLETYKRACKYEPDVIVTDNVLLYEALLENSKFKIICTDFFLEAKDIDGWGKIFSNWGLEIDSELNTLFKKNILSNSIQEAATFFMNLLSLICKVEGLKRAIKLSKLKKVIISVSHNSKWKKIYKHSRFISPYIFLAENNFFGNSSIILDKHHADLNEGINETISKNLLLRLTSAKILDNFIWKLSEIKKFKRKSTEIFIKGDSEIIREVSAKLFLKAEFSISDKNILLMHDCSNTDKFNVNKPEDYKPYLRDFLKKKLLNIFNYNDNQVTAIVNYSLKEIDLNLSNSITRALETNLFFKLLNSKYPKIKIIIVSAPNGTSAKYFHNIAKKYKKLIINFEHGLTTGLSMRNKYFMNFSEATNCDYMFVANKLAKKDYESHITKNIGKIYDIGIPLQVQTIPYRFIQRFINRSSFNIKRNEICICHVSTLLLNGSMRYGPHTAIDHQVISFNKSIINNVYNKLKDKKVIFKDYPSKRFVFQPTLKERSGSNNIIFEENGDWRYIRAAADVIVTMSPTSTLTWCIGANVPIVWINLPWAKLRHKWLNEKFKKAFFYFDATNVNWTNDLHNFLSLSKNEINTIWNEKKKERKILIKEYLYGSNNAAEKASNIIKEILR